MWRRRLSLKCVKPSLAVGRYRYRVITTGSPVASAVSGPGADDPNAICLPSGDQLVLSPCPGSGEFEPVIGARNGASDPSGWTIQRPACLPSWRVKLSHCPSCDHRGEPATELSSPSRDDLRVAASITQSCE